ncbi:MAG: DNA/RNA nuclease SfsA [Armatimonadetes bacterium]|nr:DNA/RNA nuclease SfsA [Candidatus Hippobium faecium]
MGYRNIEKGIFLDRPNRFIAHIKIGDRTETVHVKNTGRCREILVPGSVCYLEKSDNPARKTKYDLVSAVKGDRIINIDSQAVNKIFYEYMQEGKFLDDIVYIRPETVFGKSRFDFYAERSGGQKLFIEVKGVTLENNGIVSFPDAPTERGRKHLYELITAKKQGFEAYIVFVVQMKDVLYFTPHDETDPLFGQALREAVKQGVEAVAFDCVVGETEIYGNKRVKIKL